MGDLKIMYFPFGTNGKFIILGVPILKHITVDIIACRTLLIYDIVPFRMLIGCQCSAEYQRSAGILIVIFLFFIFSIFFIKKLLS